MAGMVNDDQVAQVGTSPSDHSNKEQNCSLDQQEQKERITQNAFLHLKREMQRSEIEKNSRDQFKHLLEYHSPFELMSNTTFVTTCPTHAGTVSCEEGSCCISESVTQEKSESGQTPNITQALAATPVHTQKVALELCWYCLKSQSTEGLTIPQLQVDSEDLTLPPSGERLNYQRDPRPHFGVAHSSRSVSFPLWDSDRPREMKRGEEKEEAVDSVSCCPHCHLGLPRDTLRWHEVKCLMFDGQRNSSS